MKRTIEAIAKGIFGALRRIYRILPIPRSIRGKISRIIWKVATRERKPTKKDYKAYVDAVFQTGARDDEFVDYKDNDISFTDESVKPIAFYLPQFHTFPENDEWWGRGFTEWTNVTKAVPQFVGHYQPHLPIDMGFYDLSNTDVMKRQVELAKNYGIYGFCFHYYWFGGKRLLEKPLENYLSDSAGLDFPFCICWANENWTRRWDGFENDVLMAQRHSREDSLSCIADICRYIRDDRYIRVNGKPIIIIYRADILPNVEEMLLLWRDYCRENGVGEILIICAQTFDTLNPPHGFDGAVEFPPHYLWSRSVAHNISHKQIKCGSGHEGMVFNMEEHIRSEKYLTNKSEGVYKSAFPNWDNTPRRGKIGDVFQSSPKLYREWLGGIMRHTRENFEAGNRYVFINAWNEWGEGAHLEPDRKFGYAYLQATADCVMESKSSSFRLP